MSDIRDFSEATAGLQKKTAQLEHALNLKRYDDAAEISKGMLEDVLLTYTWAIYKAGMEDALLPKVE